MTLLELTGKLKEEGHSERDIKQQLLETFGKERLKSFGEGAIIPVERVEEVIQGLEGPNAGRSSPNRQEGVD